jgi:hypothetical protein
MQSQQAQRRIIAAALFSINGTTHLLSHYEQLVAEQYIQGQLTIQSAIALLKEYQNTQLSNCGLA